VSFHNGRRFRDTLLARASDAGVAIDLQQGHALEAYFELLARWNRRINLTALPLDPPTDIALDRLFIEPLIAAEALGDNSYTGWIDLGSGGGSPAIPMKTAWPATKLTMVESKSRKAAFLREAIREIPLIEASVAESRFERLAGIAVAADLVTVRAVKPDSRLFVTAYSLLGVGGKLAMFCSSDQGSIDSLDTVDVMMALEEPTGREFTEDETPAFSGPERHRLPGRSSLVVWRKRKL
jgi:16S rRNA (guanine527-N7)-methyltransferase